MLNLSQIEASMSKSLREMVAFDPEQAANVDTREPEEDPQTVSGIAQAVKMPEQPDFGSIAECTLISLNEGSIIRQFIDWIKEKIHKRVHPLSKEEEQARKELVNDVYSDLRPKLQRALSEYKFDSHMRAFTIIDPYRDEGAADFLKGKGSRLYLIVGGYDNPASMHASDMYNKAKAYMNGHAYVNPRMKNQQNSDSQSEDIRAFKEFISNVEQIIKASHWGTCHIDGSHSSSMMTVSLTLDSGKIEEYRNAYSNGKSDSVDWNFEENAIPEDLMYLEAYQSYLETLIECEDSIKKYMAENVQVIDESIVDCNTGEPVVRPMFEAMRLQDEVRNKWDTLLKFIQSLIDRFSDAIKRILMNNKGYLEKYKTVILNTKWRADQTFEYYGNYKEAVDRCFNTPVPEFSYEVFAPALRADGYDAALKQFMTGKGFRYDANNKNIADQFKAYFLALEYGKTTGKFSDLVPRQLYDFCYNVNNIFAVVNKDREIMKRASNALQMAVDKEMREKGENPMENPVTNQTTNTVARTMNPAANTGMNTTTGGTNTASVNASAIIDANGHWITEADNVTTNTNANPATNAAGADKRQPASTQLKINTTQPTKTDTNGNVQPGNQANKPKGTTTNQDMDVILQKWITLCRALVAAKLTAIQKISKDYMDIIRAHVRATTGENEVANQQPKQQQQAQNQNQK